MAERCEQRAQDADDNWWQCTRPAGHDGHHWYDDWKAMP